ncbi:MAG: non-canonical purine NTP diphosphatase [Bacteroidetes bacterium]|nr:non-canonical purine NTP diphosphatase [Bacteroidota bacterium]
MKLIFATHNINKLREIKSIIKSNIELVSLDDVAFFDEIPEPFDTLHENALAKARHIYNRFCINCFADDTGLEVEALNGKPGVMSARYAGESKSDKENIKKLINELSGKANRNARFRTVISLILDNKEYYFEGIVNGRIIDIEKGSNGFGYDPVFIPNGFNKTFAEMTMEEKNLLSHRSAAVKKLVDFLNSL